MFYEELGLKVEQLIFEAANRIVADYWPGLISAAFVVFLVIFSAVVWRNSNDSIAALRKATRAVKECAGPESGAIDLAKLEDQIQKMTGSTADQIGIAFSEFRKTVLVTGRGDNIKIRHVIRPAAYLGADELGLTMRGWRSVPGLFVSLGLFFTFLGLVAVLSSTVGILPDGHNGDQAQIMEALRALLNKASAKFTISLTGLLCSILFNLFWRHRVSEVEKEANGLVRALEESLDFISLEGLADSQLRAIKDQTESMKELNTRLIAELSEPLKKVSDQSIDNVSAMVRQLGTTLTTGIGGSLGQVSDQIEAAGKALLTVSTSLQDASQQFDTSLKTTTNSLDETVQRLDQIAKELTTAAQAVEEVTPPVLEAIKESSTHTLRIAEGSTQMVNSAKTAISEEKQVVVEAMTAIQTLIRSFESRASAYDGQLEKAFQTYQTEVAKTIDRLESHGRGVENRFAEALSTLQSVIENAKAFEPESSTKPHEREADQ